MRVIFLYDSNDLFCYIMVDKSYKDAKGKNTKVKTKQNKPLFCLSIQYTKLERGGKFLCLELESPHEN